MSEEVAPEDLVTQLKAARKRPAVLKAKLATLRSMRPEITILAMEGVEDKAIYHQWVQRVRPELRYEPFPCGGKKHVLSLKDVLDRDLGNLRDGVFFVIDRDFDDLAGRDADRAIFMTDRYSTENYLVDRDVF